MRLDVLARGLGLSVTAVVLAGCLGNKDAHQPGTALGTFGVNATLTSNTCGEGALGIAGDWSFDVRLAKGEGEIFWNNGAEEIAGELAQDGVTFSFETLILVDMRRAEEQGLPPCKVDRKDLASGVLRAKGDVVEGFGGQLSYEFAPSSGSSCDDLVHGPKPILAALPCAMGFSLDASLKAAP